MKLFEMFRPRKPVVVEGGNVSSQSPGWQGAADQEAEEIDLKIHDRDFMVSKMRELLAAQNESFKAAYGRYIWEPKLLKSGQMFSGSSLTFFDVKGVNTQDFMNKLKKTKVGDIDTQVDQEIGDEITAWLKSIIGKKVGNGTFLGFNSSLSSIWLLDDPQVRVQVDYELGPYDPKTQAPTEWFAYSHSSSYDDMAAGIKGVFHKYINRALTHSQASEKYVARVLKKGVKISDEPVTDSDYSFAVSGGQGGGMSKKYKPYVDPNTGEPMMKDGIPVMQQLDPKDRDYIQNLDQQFMINFGRKRTAADKNLQNSFVGTLQLMNRSFTPEQNDAVARAFLNILFGPGAQMITKDDPERDRDIKFAAIDAMLLGGNGIKPLNLPDGTALRQEAVKMAMDYADKFKAKKAGKVGAPMDTEVAEDVEAAAAAKPNYARQGIKHLYNRLPDGRVSSAEMKNADFLEIAKEIANNGGTLNGLPISLKVDGAGIRFGKDASGRPFFMTSKVTTPLYQDDVGYFTQFGQEKGQDAEQLARTKKYDDALELITGSKFIQSLPADTIVQAEMMYNPMAQQTDQGLKFVNIPYDPKKLGKQMTLVPFVVKQYSTGEDRPDADKIKKRLLAASDSNIKIVSNNLEQKGINVSKIIDPILNLDPKDKANIPAFDKAKQELSSAIIDNPKLAGKDALGDNMEGIVVNMPSGQMFKITSQQMKSVMAAKMSQPAAKRQGPLKTAVVAIGSFAGHLGHEDLFNATLNKAKELGGDAYLFIGNAVGKDDPIPTDVKVQTWHKLYPQYAGNISSVMQGGSIMQKVKHELINPQPGQPPRYDNIVIMVGEDRKDMPLAGALMKAVNKFPGYEHVKVSLETIPRTRPISFTKLRDVLKNPNATPEQQYAVWAQGFNAEQLGKDWILHLMDISRKGMGVSQQPAAAPQPAPVAEVRLFNALVRPSLLENKTNEEAAGVGVIASKKQAKDPRYSMSLTKDVRPGQIQKNLKAFGLAESDYQLDEGLGDWIFKKIDDYLDVPKPSSDQISKAMKSAPANLPDDVAEKLVANFMQKAEAQRLAQQAAEAQKTTVEKIVPYLTYFARAFVNRWKQIPQRDRENVLKNLANNLLRFLMFVLESLAKGLVKKEDTSQALAHTAKSLENPPKVMQHRARRDQERDQQLKGRDIAKRNEEFNSEYDDEAGMAQSNLRTMARAVDGLLKTIKNNDNLPEWGQEKIAKAEMMLVSVWDYLLSQKELGMDPKVNESRALAELKQIVAELSSEKLGQYKKAAGAQASAADKAGDTKKADKRFSGIVKATKKQFDNDAKGVAEGIFGLSANEKAKIQYITAKISDIPGNWDHKNQTYTEQGLRDLKSVMKNERYLNYALSLTADDYEAEGVAERMLPKSAFAGTGSPTYHKLGPAAHAKGKQKGPVKRGQFVGGMEEGAPIVVAQAPIHIRNPKKAPQTYRNQGDIVPPTKPPSTEKRGVKGRPGQRPMPDYSVEEAKKKGADGKACWKGYRYAGTENGKDKCVPVSENVENIMGALIDRIIVNEAIQNNQR